MTKLILKLREFSVRNEGAALVEYGLILGLVVAVGGAGLAALGTSTQNNVGDAAAVVANP